MTTPPAPARLFVLLARSAPVGVILRRGPSDWVQMIHWDTKHDVFTPGRWFHGRIYEHRCDISPNGRYVVYCAYKPGNKRTNPSYGDRWTAISKPPYFNALALWTIKDWIGGGGFFIERKKMLLNHLEDNATLHPDYSLGKVEIDPMDGFSFMRNSIYFHRMLRDKWRGGSKTWKTARLPFWYKGSYLRERDANIRLAKWPLVCRIFYRYRIVENHGLARASLYETVPEYRYSLAHYGLSDIDLSGVTWAGVDFGGRALFAKEGKLFTVTITDRLKISFTELADFNSNKPEWIETPDWAKIW